MAASPAPPELCVGAVALDGDRLLLIRRGRGAAQGTWSVPGGKVDAGETVAAAVVRELAEETGMEGVCDGLIGWVELLGPSHHYVIMDFAVTVLSPGEPVAGDDAAEAAWVPLVDVAGLVLADGLAEFLHRPRHRAHHRMSAPPAVAPADSPTQEVATRPLPVPQPLAPARR